MTDDLKNPPPPIWAQGLPPSPEWQDHDGSIIFENPWMRLTRHRVTAPTGVEADYVVVRPRNLGAGVLPIHDDGTVSLVGQHRFALMAYSWEMPEGGVPEGEDPLAGIQRELAEESGLRAKHWLPALSMDLSNSITDERVMSWLAWGLEPAEGEPDETEVLTRVRVPFKTLLSEVERGGVRDAMTVATVYRAYHMARENRLPGWLAHIMLSRV